MRGSNWSRGFGYPGLSGGESGECVEQGYSVFACGGGVGADGGELLGAGHGAHGSGDFLSDFRHAYFLFGGVVVEGDGEGGGEAEVVVEAVTDPAGEGAMLVGQRAGRGVVGGGDGGRVVDEPAVMVEDGRIQVGQSGRLGLVDGGLEVEQCSPGLLGPAPGPVVGGGVDHCLQLAQQVGVA